MIFKRIGLLSLMFLIFACGSTNKVRVTTTKAEQQEKDKQLAASQSSSDASTKTETKASETLEATSKVSTTSATVSDYILQFKDVAKNNMKTYGIPASITLAQGILESGAGKGRLCLEANNHFGIKCHTGWTGPSVTHDDDAAQECFRKYNDPAESYKDHSLFLTSRSRYASLFKLDELDYEGWAKGLKAAGYATDPKYPSKLIGLIERYQLYLYDQEVASPSGEVFSASTPVVDEEPSTKEETSTTVQVEIPVSSEQAQQEVAEVIETVETAVEVSKTEVEEVADKISEGEYIVQKGDTLYSLSRRFNTTVEDLKEKNNLSDNSIAIGQILKVK
ncbi:glucosaminidase domain-containing protein [Flavobacterium sp. NRK F10]|uniref:Peptidoglycan hydrolase n=1 Tax=Flavobacterium sediminis TaxID=2201181 RepID=A0A2U8QWL0_9FLAO|nr:MULTISPECIES: glucosaminidase domain-containing protein [Flavobacterium]AWM14266.1 hemagglutinin [Flavobacterium sediminis]MCO6175466.1 glucosaminidase domain-containing protein [Flavobacterium sp. NRK F10]